MNNENSTVHRVLKRLASLKMSDDDPNPALVESGTSYVNYSAIAQEREIKPSVLENVRKAIQSWRTRAANVRDSRVRARRQQLLLNEEQKMRHKLEYHFMTPFEKYRKGRKPWKLAIQILKIVIVTIQVSLFAVDRFAFISFFKHTEDSYHHLFIQGWKGDTFISYYSRQEVIDAVKFAHQRFLKVRDLAIGNYDYLWYDNASFSPMKYCTRYREFENGSTLIDTDDTDIYEVCVPIKTSSFDPSNLVLREDYFQRVDSIELRFKLKSIYLAGLKLLRKSECFRFDITHPSFKDLGRVVPTTISADLGLKIKIDNSKNDGRLPVSLTSKPQLWPNGCNTYQKGDEVVTKSLQAFDIIAVLVCALSCLLCLRSVFKSIKLAKKAKIYFKEYRSEDLTRWDLLQLINKWFIVIVISDCLAITGSFFKLLIDSRDITYYNQCSIIFGMAVLLVWIGLLRFLTYLKAYNILMITLRVATPSLLRFISCVIFIFLGFSFCGWIVLGPYHLKFRTLLLTMECLFSLLNGDDMYPTFTNVSDRAGTAVQIFSKLYLYGFISFFIYVVLSTFISIVGDTYERLKDLGRLPATKIERFITGRHKESSVNRKRGQSVCRGCARSATHASGTSSPSTLLSYVEDSFHSSFRSSFNDSQISVDSTSLE